MSDAVLNPEQIKAVEFGDGPLLIVAGAGTGKTTVITERIHHLIKKRDVHPEHILALTFTEKAAREMEERVDRILPYGYSEIWILTFHAFCDRILKREAIHIGLDPTFKLLSEAESIMLLREHLYELDLKYFRPLGNPGKFIQGMLTHFNRLQDDDISPKNYREYAANIAKENILEPTEIQKIQELSTTYERYQTLKAEKGYMDFSDMIAHVLTLFRTRPAILKKYQEQFQFILVDEFQDTNFAQNELAMLLAGVRKNITVVGDDDQAIYRWRGAALSNIMEFRSRFPDTAMVTLTRNYRSTKQILDASYELITHNNPDRLEVQEKIDKKLIPYDLKKGQPVEFLYALRGDEEAEKVAKKIQELTKKEYQYNDIALLVRANDHSLPFQRVFERLGIPYQFLGPANLFHQEEIKDLIAYLRVLADIQDSESMYRVISNPVFGITSRDVAVLLSFAKRKNYSLFEAMEHNDELDMPDLVKQTIRNLLQMLQEHLADSRKKTAGQILFSYFEKTGLYTKALSPTSAEEEQITENLVKFFNKIKAEEHEIDNPSVFRILAWIDTAMELGESPMAAEIDWMQNNAVNILTVHASKGLEFPVVFVLNLIKDRFPGRVRGEQIPIPEDLVREKNLPTGDEHLQEERRLCYVAMTRAKERLFLTASTFYGDGKRERKISPFIADALGEEIVEKARQILKQTETATQLSLLDMATLTPTSVTSRSTVETKLQKITYISYSQIQTFDVCPLHYKLRYILKVPTPESPALSIGISTHDALKEYFQKMIDLGKSDEDIETILKRTWKSEGFDSKAHEKFAFTEAQDMLKNYISAHPAIPLATEVPFKFYLDGIQVGGRIDRIDMLKDGRLEIIDYKTGVNQLTERKAATDLQMTFYALAANMVRTPLLNKKPEEIMLSLHYLKSGDSVTTTRTEKQLEEAKQFILEKVDEIAHSDFRCSKNQLCKNCEYAMLCQTFAN